MSCGVAFFLGPCTPPRLRCQACPAPPGPHEDLPHLPRLRLSCSVLFSCTGKSTCRGKWKPGWSSLRPFSGSTSVPSAWSSMRSSLREERTRILPSSGREVRLRASRTPCVSERSGTGRRRAVSGAVRESRASAVQKRMEQPFHPAGLLDERTHLRQLFPRQRLPALRCRSRLVEPLQ